MGQIPWAPGNGLVRQPASRLLCLWQGTAAEDAAFDIALACEGSPCDAGFAAFSVVGDLEKGFEMVTHAEAARATATHGFPMRIARLAIHMYRGARRLAWKGSRARPLLHESGRRRGMCVRHAHAQCGMH